MADYRNTEWAKYLRYIRTHLQVYHPKDISEYYVNMSSFQKASKEYVCSQIAGQCTKNQCTLRLLRTNVPIAKRSRFRPTQTGTQ